MDFFDYDPDAKDQASQESRERVAAGFKALVERMEAIVDIGKAARIERHRRQIERGNEWFGIESVLPTSPAPEQHEDWDRSQPPPFPGD